MISRFSFAVIAVVLATTPAFSASGAKENMQRIISGLDKANIKWEPVANTPCLNDGYCSIYAGNVQINTVGWTAEAMVTSLDPFEKYASVCSAALAGLISGNLNSARKYISQGFRDASRGERAKYDIAGTELTIRRSYDDRLGCHFFRK